MLFEFSGESEPDNFWQDHGDSLAKHDGFGLDSSYSPAYHSQAVDHSGVRVSSDYGIWVYDFLGILEDDSGEIFEVDLMNDTTSWWDDGEVVKGGGSPFQKLKSLKVPFELDLFVFFPGVLGSRDVDLDTVIHDEIDWAEGVDLGRVGSHSLDCVSHGGQINYCWYAGEILEDDSGGFEGNFNLRFGKLFPVEDVFYVLGLYFELVTVSNSTFEEYSDTEG